MKRRSTGSEFLSILKVPSRLIPSAVCLGVAVPGSLARLSGAAEKVPRRVIQFLIPNHDKSIHALLLPERFPLQPHFILQPGNGSEQETVSPTPRMRRLFPRSPRFNPHHLHVGGGKSIKGGGGSIKELDEGHDFTRQPQQADFVLLAAPLVETAAQRISGKRVKQRVLPSGVLAIRRRN